MNGAHFTFQTSAFADTPDVLAQNVNGIAGHSLAAWLSRMLNQAGFAASEPWPEDHGWDFSVAHQEARYLCVCAIEDSGDSGERPRDGHVSVDRMRTLMDRLAGRNKFTADDSVAAAIRTVLAGSSEVSGLEPG
jgi:hypothetical protein